MARKLIVEIVGDSKQLERSFASANRSVKGFASTTDTTLGRVETRFASLSKIAAGGFLGGTIAYGLKSLVDAAANSEQVLGQTRVALESTGKAWAVYGREIESTVAKQSSLGFDDEALMQTFSLFVRQSKDVGQALRENNLAMDVARARFISLEQAAQIVNKAALGQAGALRRIGIDARNGASGMELLAQLERDFGGSAKAAANDGATAMDRFRVSVDNAKESVGALALPALSNLANVLGKAANNASRLVDELDKINAPGGRSLKDVLLGTDITQIPGLIEDSLTPPWKWDQVAESQAKAATSALADAFEKNVPSFVAVLNGALSNPADFSKQKGVDTGSAVAGMFAGGVQAFIDAARRQADAAVKAANKATGAANAEKAAQARQEAFAKLVGALQLGVDRATLTRRLDDDVAALNALKAGLLKQVRAGVDVASAQSQLVTVTRQIADTQEQIRKTAQGAVQAAQFRALGLDSAGNKPPPVIANLKKQLEQLSSRPDLGVNANAMLARIRKVLVDPINKATPETRAAIESMFDTIRRSLKQGADGVAKTTIGEGLNTRKVLAGLGLSPDQVRELRGRLSHTTVSGLTMPTSRPAVAGGFAGPGMVVESHTNLYLDGDLVARNVTKNQQAAVRRNPRQKRGPNRSGV